MAKRSEELLKKVFSVHRIVSLWLFGDVAFAVIPIVTIAIINILLGVTFHDFLLIKEWSFATIVFFGVSVRKLIRLKVQIQQTPKSYKLDTGVQIYVLLLIASVLILSFVILGEKGVLVQQRAALGAGQLGLFLIGISSILIAVIVEEQYYKDEQTLPHGILKIWLVRRVIWHIEQANNSVSYAVYAMQQASEIKFNKLEGDSRSQYEEERLHLRLRAEIERLEQSLSEGKQLLDQFKAPQSLAASGQA